MKTSKKSTLTIEEIIHVGKLANLFLKNNEIEKFKHQLSEVVNYINKLRALDTQDIEPTSQITNLKNVFREDKVKRPLTQTEALSNAKSSYNGFFQVKAIFEE